MIQSIAHVQTDNQLQLAQKTKNLRKLFTVSYLYVVASALYSISLPNLLLLVFHFPAQQVGILTSISAFARLIGPLFLRKASSKIGIKKSLILTISITISTIFIELMFMRFSVLICTHLIDGLFGSLFWVNIQQNLANIQKDMQNHNSSKIFQNFGLSWNYGAISGEFLGLIIVAGGFQDRLIIFLSNFILLAVFAIIIKMEFRSKTSQNVQKIQKANSNETLLNETLPSSKKEASMHQLLILFPIWFILLGEITFQFLKSSTNFYFYILIDQNPISSTIIYLIFFGQQIAQLGMIYVYGKMPVKFKPWLFMLAILVSISIVFMWMIFNSSFVIIFAMLGIGLCGGIIYSFPAQLLMHKSQQSANLKLTSIYEMLSSLAYGIAPLMSNVMLRISTHAVSLMIIGTLLPILLAFLFKVLHMQRHHPSTHIEESPVLLLLEGITS